MSEPALHRGNLIPKLLPDLISQPWRKNDFFHDCEIKHIKCSGAIKVIRRNDFYTGLSHTCTGMLVNYQLSALAPRLSFRQIYIMKFTTDAVGDHTQASNIQSV